MSDHITDEMLNAACAAPQDGNPSVRDEYRTALAAALAVAPTVDGHCCGQRLGEHDCCYCSKWVSNRDGQPCTHRTLLLGPPTGADDA